VIGRGDRASNLPTTKSGAVLTRITDALDAICRAAGIAVAWLIVPMVGSLVWEVTARYLFNAPTEWAYDMTFMLYGTFFMVGAAWTLQRGGHIRTDTFYADWSRRTRARVDLACYALFFFPAIAIFGWLGAEFFWKSFQQNERIVTSPWLPIVWPFKFMMPASALLLVLQGVSESLKAWARAFGPDDDADATEARPGEGEVSA
jgi:TRAP-type mannitol/chloroaromatic compound transport system permease small subunit